LIEFHHLRHVGDLRRHFMVVVTSKFQAEEAGKDDHGKNAPQDAGRPCGFPNPFCPFGLGFVGGILNFFQRRHNLPSQIVRALHERRDDFLVNAGLN